MEQLPKVGSQVRLKKGVARHYPGKTAEVVLISKEIEGGVLLRDRLDGFCWWNKDDLEPA